jgi:hypothetical protein
MQNNDQSSQVIQNNNQLTQRGLIGGALLTGFYGLVPLAGRAMCNASTTPLSCQAGVDQAFTSASIGLLLAASAALGVTAHRLRNLDTAPNRASDGISSVQPNAAPTAVNGNIVSVQTSGELGQNLV